MVSEDPQNSGVHDGPGHWTTSGFVLITLLKMQQRRVREAAMAHMMTWSIFLSMSTLQEVVDTNISKRLHVFWIFTIFTVFKVTEKHNKGMWQMFEHSA